MGHHEILIPQGISMDSDGNGPFLFPADRLHYGPVRVRILARDDVGRRDLCESTKAAGKRKREIPHQQGGWTGMTEAQIISWP